MKSEILISSLKKNIKLCVICILVIVTCALADPVSINYMHKALEQAERANINYGLFLIIFYCFFITISQIGVVVSNFFSTKLSKSIALNMKKNLLQHFIKVKLYLLNKLKRGQILNAFTSCDNVSSSVVMPFSQILSLIIKLVVGLVMILRISKLVVMIILLPIPFWIMLNKWVTKRIELNNQNDKNNQIKVWNHISELFSSLEEHKIWNWKNSTVNKYSKLKDTCVHTSITGIKLLQLKSIIEKVFLLIGFIITFLLGYFSIIKITRVDLIAIYFYSNMIYQSIILFNSVGLNFTFMSTELSKINKIVELDIETNGKYNNSFNTNKPIIKIFKGLVKFNNKEILNRVNLEVYKNEFIAIVGQSGTGKSSLLNIILGADNLYAGEYFFNGINSKCIDWIKMRNDVGVLTQKPLLFSGNIRDNILFDEPLSNKMLIKALEESATTEIITKKANGINTSINENGVGLSIGENQRVALCRVFYNGYPIWVFDEPTASIDEQNENIIYQALKKEKGKRTIVIVTHRKKILELADKIYIISNKTLKRMCF